MTGRAAKTRSVNSFFSLDATLGNRYGICRGLSCELNGAEALAARMTQYGSMLALNCLGCCDQSPAMLLPGGQPCTGKDALHYRTGQSAESLRQPVSIRSISRRPVVTERLAQGSFAAIDKALQGGVYSTWRRFLGQPGSSILEIVGASGHLGRGGAGFSTAEKWRQCSAVAGARKYVIANGDEGDPGSFIDRVIMENDPHALLEGLALCAYAVGAEEGIVFIRAEYPQAAARVEQAIVEAREAGLLGPGVLGSRFSFDVRVASGRGSYVCGEETALLNAIEGKRGEVRLRPPYPVTAGLYGAPTVVNNIETLVNIPWILRFGADAYRSLGTPTSPGTKAFCFNRGFSRPGIVEAEFGLSLRDLVEVHGGGCREQSQWQAVVLGGPMGSVLESHELDVAVDYPVLAERGIQLGHGGLVMIPASTALADVLRNFLVFMAEESCGKCVPCALGSARLVELADKLTAEGESPDEAARGMLTLLDSIENSSLCGFGQAMPGTVRTLVRMTHRDLRGRRASA